MKRNKIKRRFLLFDYKNIKYRTDDQTVINTNKKIGTN